MEQMNEAVASCVSGHSERFAEVYDAYIKKIYDFIYYKTLHKETAEDLTSTTFMKALEKIQTFDDSKGSFSSWLYRIARNTVIDHYRTRKVAQDVSDIWWLSTGEDIERDAEVYRQLEDVEKYLMKLKPQQREIVIMRVWDQLSYKEIAEITGISESNCKMTFSRTIRHLRETFGSGVVGLLIVAIATTIWLQR